MLTLYIASIFILTCKAQLLCRPGQTLRVPGGSDTRFQGGKFLSPKKGGYGVNCGRGGRNRLMGGGWKRDGFVLHHMLQGEKRVKRGTKENG
jgi:hypothetical protein